MNVRENLLVLLEFLDEIEADVAGMKEVGSVQESIERRRAFLEKLSLFQGVLLLTLKKLNDAEARTSKQIGLLSSWQ